MRFVLPLLLIFFACTPTDNSKEKDTTDPTISEVKKEVEAEQTSEETASTETPVKEVVTGEDTSDEYEDIDWQEYMESMTKDFSFVIVMSTKSYDAALKRAKDASEKLGYKLDLRGLVPNDEMGLTLPEEVCTGLCGNDEIDFPQYLPRSDWGDSKYVSIEYSDSFNGFTKGYFIVVVASSEKGDSSIKEALTEAKKFYKDAYAKTCGVWIGCGC